MILQQNTSPNFLGLIKIVIYDLGISQLSAITHEAALLQFKFTPRNFALWKIDLLTYTVSLSRH